jgi:hypothetical protein
MVNSAVIAGHNSKPSWTRGLVNYAQLSTFQDPMPAHGTTGQPPEIGIHLHWALPKALVHATQITATGLSTLTGSIVTSVTVDNSGSGYIAPPTVTLTGGGGYGATAVAQLTNGAVSGITVIASGQGYNTAPKVEIAPSPEICFPLVPNRWMVTRFDPATTTNGPRKTTSWIVTSDEINEKDGKAPFVNPTTSTAGDVKPAQIGVIRELSAWTGESNKAGTDLFLRAIGPGEISFHSYQPGATNVFGICDDLGSKGGTQPVPFAEDAEFTYQVLGWYSDPSEDPMFGPVTHWGKNGAANHRTSWAKSTDPVGAWTSLMAALNWAVDDAPTTAADLPEQSLYHGMIHSVSWTNVNIPPRVNSSTAGMTVCIGNTTADALSAYVKAHAGSVGAATLEIQELEALNFNALKTLDKADGPAQIEMLIRNAWFSNAPGGTTWEIVQNADDDFKGLSAAAAPPPPPLTPTQLGQLADLNKAQVALDIELRALQSDKWSLFATWWKNERRKSDNDWKSYVKNPQAILDRITNNLDPSKPGLYSEVVAKENAIAHNPTPLPQPTNPVSIAQYAEKTLKLDPTLWTLKATNAAPFYAPTDPVVMVSGLKPSNKQKTQFPKYAQGVGWDDTLNCRTLDQATNGILSGVHAPTDATPAAKFSDEITAIKNSNLLPAVQFGVTAMLVETFLSDPQNAATIVSVVNGGAGTPAQNTHLESAMRDCTAQVVKAGENWTPAIKEPTAYETWEQAWSPLYIDWSINFFATTSTTQTGDKAPGEVCDNWALDMSEWNFDGTDYTWTGGNPANGNMGYNGRTFLTGQANFALISRLHHYLENAKANGKTGKEHEAGLQAVEDLIEKVGAMNFMSQQLTGLTDAMVMRTVNPGNPPSPDIAPTIGAQYNETPDPSNGDETIKFGEGDPFFFPVRGGYMVFTSLSIVDAFGQMVDLMSAGGNNGSGAGFRPLCGAGLAPTANPHVNTPSLLQAVYLQPRVVQPARLNFDFLSASDDKKILGQSADVNPVCGWIIPNHLDRGLNVYDADGVGLGELITLVDINGVHKLDWLPTPISAGAITDPATIPDLHLRGFVQGLLARDDDGAGFRNFLSCVDETQWTIDPQGGRKNQNLSVLIGRPLALVRCKLGLELDGSPYENQSWRDTLTKQGAGLEKQKFQIRMGSLDLFDDGLLGYFTGDDYDNFHAVHEPEGLAPATKPYLVPIAKGAYLDAAFDGTDQTITMVLDPRGDVHMSTGILPVQRVTLPNEFVTPVMGQFALTFRTGPVLSETAQVRIPYPTERHGDWSWAQLTVPTVPGQAADYTRKSLVKTGHEARLDSAPPALMEGWLAFKPDGKD